MNKANRLTLITLGVADLAASRAFYERLGMVADESADTVAFFDLGGFKLGLFGLDALAAEQGREPGELGRGAATLAINWQTADAVDTAYQIALDAGAKVVRRPRNMEWGGYSSYWSDPDGHVWEYAYNPDWPLDADGRLASG